jgi:hypothetical protein
VHSIDPLFHILGLPWVYQETIFFNYSIYAVTITIQIDYIQLIC